MKDLSLSQMTSRTVAAAKMAVQKAATAGILTSTGGSGLDLAPFVSLQPVETPFYNTTPRTAVAQGSFQTVWQTYQNVSALQKYGFTSANNASVEMTNQIQTNANPFGKTGIRQVISLDALAQAEGYVDLYSFGVMQTILQKLIQEDILMLNGLNFSLGTPVAPTVTASATGGTIPASTAVNVQVAVRSGLNYYAGGSTIASAIGTVTTASTGATNSATATLSPTPDLGVAYDWFVAGYYYTTTSLPTVLITSIPTANAAVPNVASLPLLFEAGQVAITSVPNVDTSYDPNGWAGLTASILADLTSVGSPSVPANYTTPGTGVSQGAYHLNLAGGQLTADGPQIVQINDAVLSLYNTYQMSPTRILMAAQQFSDISTTILGTVNAVNYFDPTSVSQHRGLVIGGSTPVYVDPTTGAAIPIQVQPHLPPGIMVLMSDVIPFPASNVGSSVEVRTQYDNFLFQYGVTSSPASGPSGPRWDVEISSRETFVNYAAPTMQVISGIAPGVAAA